jgi:hypothetical protein
VSERWRRQQLVHADLSAADFRPESPDLGKLASIGVTNAPVVPKGDGISGERFHRRRAAGDRSPHGASR